MDIGQPTLEQLRIFLAVIDEGGFNPAARKLGRAVSVISYAIASLESQLDLALFDREGSRRPRLTDAGRSLMPAARAVVDETAGLMARARSIHAGVETEVAIALDVMVPLGPISAILQEFQQVYPLVDLRLHVEALGAVASLLLQGRADLAVAGPVLIDLPELQRREIGTIELVPVAAPGHPLARLDTILPGQSRQYLQLVLTDRSAYTEGQEFSVLSPRTWRLADLGAKHELLLSGSGWGNMPLHAVADDIERGRLKRLAIPEGARIEYRLNALWRHDSLPGPATMWLLEAFEAAL
ncbi:LysR family transcriptional regulator [Altererythrobacter aerius]|uniref:LysR family transcriptional regulator n=1 Tax=Tsuneonella aeria TaxID=1837929 RepID=A0A6I4TDK5_9SPHN|nr:LysR family transcriptional regulator [Tsuneonella aeria]MXO74727.1 LysR family transcriptional regulator [Tsuneonella aeria]